MAQQQRRHDHPGHRRRRRCPLRGRTAVDPERAARRQCAAARWCSKWRSISARTPCARSRWTRPTGWCAAPRWSIPASPIMMPVGPETLGRILNVIGEPVDERGPVIDQAALADPQAGARIHRPVDRGRNPGHRHQGRRSAGALREGRQGRAVRRRRRRQDRHHHGADQQHRQGAWRLLGVRRGRRAHQIPTVLIPRGSGELPPPPR